MAPSLICILWPAFLAACALELLVFGFVDPHELQLSPRAFGGSRQAVYTAAFFAFWFVSAGACALAVVLRNAPAGTDRRPAGPG